ncbi:MAG: hypothetical protein AB8B81_09170 [Halioglobus sp.]
MQLTQADLGVAEFFLNRILLRFLAGNLAADTGDVFLQLFELCTSIFFIGLGLAVDWQPE